MPESVGPSFRSTCAYTYILTLCGSQFVVGDTHLITSLELLSSTRGLMSRHGGVCHMWDPCWGEVKCGNLRESLIEIDLNCRGSGSLCSPDFADG